MLKKISRTFLLLSLTVIFTAAPALAEEIFLSGSKSHEWFVKTTGEGKDTGFDVFSREIGKQYMPTMEKMQGKVLAIQAVESKLAVLLEDGVFAFISADGSVQSGRNQPGRLLASCGNIQSIDFNPTGIIAMFTSIAPPPDAKTQQPNASQWISIYKSYGLSWKLILAIPTDASAGIIASDKSGNIFFDLKTEKKPKPFIQRWSQANGLTKIEKTPENIVELISNKHGVFAITSEKLDNGQVTLSMVDPQQLTDIRQIRENQRPLEWPADAKLHFTTLGDDFGVYWQEKDKWFLIRFDYLGRARPTQDLSEALSLAPDMELAEKAVEYFSLGLIITVFLVMFLTKPYARPPKPLLLPKGFRPANLFKRLVAFIIDYLIIELPISLVIFIWIIVSQGLTAEQFREKILQSGGRLEDLIATFPEFTFAGIASIIVLVVYGIIMENRFGWTLGKKIFGLKVVTDDGIKPPLREAAIRNLMKGVEIIIIPGSWWIPGLFILVIMITRYRQRFGDLAARTVVVEPGEMIMVRIQMPGQKNDDQQNS